MPSEQDQRNLMLERKVERLLAEVKDNRRDIVRLEQELSQLRAQAG